MAVQVEIWERYLVDRLWKQNAFLKNSAVSESGDVIQGKIVHIPQPGAKPVVVKGRNTFPAIAVQRMDPEVTYSLDAYTTDPTHIFEADKREISYDKMDSVMGDHAGQLAETIADDLLIKWATGLSGSGIYQVAGAPAAAVVQGQTGTRKTMTVNDLKKLMTLMNRANVPKNDRYVLLEANHYDQLIGDLSATQYRDFSEYFDAANGVVGKLFGFSIMVRSNVCMVSGASGEGMLVANGFGVNALGQAVSPSDHVMSLAWQKSCVAQAIGEVKMFQNTEDALYYGDVYSALVRMGGRRRRNDDLGVIGIVSAP